jgi:hypothetical protein
VDPYGELVRLRAERRAVSLQEAPDVLFYLS